MNRAEAKAAVAGHTGLTVDDYKARPAGDGAWWVLERNFMHMILDNHGWVVLADGRVFRAVPPGSPILPATDLRKLSESEEAGLAE